MTAPSNPVVPPEVEKFLGDEFGMVPAGAERLRNELSVGDRRRRRRAGESEPITNMTLLEADGVLRWHIGPAIAPARVRAGRLAPPSDSVVARANIVADFKIEDTPANEIHAKLLQLDESLTPGQGLREVLADGTLTKQLVEPSNKGRILLIVHGTFSNVETVVKEIGVSPLGASFLRDALDHYDQVLAFNHPTLSVSPILNAIELGQLFRGSGAAVDVICHSRGGLVTRWWREVIDRPDRKGWTIFVGSPLQGTSLAAPARLKEALDLLTNIANTLSNVSKGAGLVFPMAAPLWKASSVLFGLFGKTMQIAAKTPVLDAGVALIPGLAAQGMERANGEVLQARRYFVSFSDVERQRRVASYRFVTSNFETDDPGWKFWRYFRKDKIMDGAADVLFPRENDLVVDTPNMTSLADLPLDINPDFVKAFGSADGVTHVGYFQRGETMEFCRKQLLP